MLTTPPLRRRSGLSIFADIVDLHLAAARAPQRHGEKALDRMSPHLLDDLGLWSGDGCVTDWGLLEVTMRVRKGWS